MSEISLEEFQANINSIIDKYPIIAEKALIKTGRKLQKLAKESAPVGTSKKKKLKDSFKVKFEGFRPDNIEVTIRSKSPHFHLVESGHRLVRNGKEVGFVQGTHFFHKMVEENINRVKTDEADYLYKEVNKIIKGGR